MSNVVGSRATLPGQPGHVSGDASHARGTPVHSLGMPVYSRGAPVHSRGRESNLCGATCTLGVHHDHLVCTGSHAPGTRCSVSGTAVHWSGRTANARGTLCTSLSTRVTVSWTAVHSRGTRVTVSWTAVHSRGTAVVSFARLLPRGERPALPAAGRSRSSALPSPLAARHSLRAARHRAFAARHARRGRRGARRAAILLFERHDRSIRRRAFRLGARRFTVSGPAEIGRCATDVVSVTATSGPGICLKSEGIGLAVMTEMPIIVIDVQRGGPSTGLPTKTDARTYDLTPKL